MWPRIQTSPTWKVVACDVQVLAALACDSKYILPRFLANAEAQKKAHTHTHTPLRSCEFLVALMEMAGQNLSSEQLDFASFWKPDPDPAVRVESSIFAPDMPWDPWISLVLLVVQCLAAPSSNGQKWTRDDPQAAKAIELKAPSSLPAVPEGTIGERSCGSELLVSCCIHIVHIFWAMVSQGVPRSLQKLHDRIWVCLKIVYP